MDTVYLETSIVSYLRQKPSTQVVLAARQLLTHQWWNDERSNYQLVASQLVIDEASAGNPSLAAERLQLLAGIPLLQLDPVIADIADEIMSRAILPEKARTDALHIATVAHHRIQYLLTWNCRHIANARILPRIHDVLNDLLIPIPVICTPEEMVGNDSEIDDN
jgi:predicted nucleic acid-binding protein